ncbi:DUF4231 domain-containing protein [Actinomycetospora aeridis]|uniref:DUF4231 domain-containing protein n=1 Tax=Actinomycetospora aeridis TaxID=3129231 RepID=A0ABU8N388_9PSEU
MSTDSFAFPAYLTAGEEASAGGQRRYMNTVRLRLIFLVLAAVGGAVSVTAEGNDPFAWLALVAFVACVGCEFFLFAEAPEKLWYEGRAAAESTKTLAWRYAVGGAPFPLGAPDPDGTFLGQIDEVASQLDRVVATSAGSGAQIPESLRSLRESDFATRRSAFETGRVADQVAWYTAKAVDCARKQKLFLLLTIVVEMLGIIGAVLRVTGTFDFDALGILAAVVSGLASWAQTRQYGALSTSYSIAARELTSIRDAIPKQTETQWPTFVGEAEEAISREHTLWLASRGLLLRRR